MTAERPVILLATDGSQSAQAATRMAVELAAATGERLLVVTVWHELRGDFGVPLTVLFPDAAEIERQHAAEVVAKVATQAEIAGVEAATLLLHGSPAHELCALACERRPNMIVIGSQGWNAFERTVFGSVSSRVLHHSGCPVLVVPDPAHGADGEADRVADAGDPVVAETERVPSRNAPDENE